MEEIKFNSLEELYNRLKPALITKCHELSNKGIININESNLWQFLCRYYWQGSEYLTLSEMVDDVLNVSDDEIINYFQNKKTNRETEE